MLPKMMLITAMAVFISGVAVPEWENEGCNAGGNSSENCLKERTLLQRRTKKGGSFGGSGGRGLAIHRTSRPAGYWKGVEKNNVKVDGLNWHLSSFWDAGVCHGWLGDDYHAGWCHWDRKKHCDNGALLTIKEAEKYCPGGKLKVTRSAGDGWPPKYSEGGCNYMFLAWFTCQSGGMPYQINVGPSGKKKKCVTPNNGKAYKCTENAANQGMRLNPGNYEDTFKVTPGSNREICVERVDANDGWGMALQIACHEKSR